MFSTVSVIHTIHNNTQQFFVIEPTKGMTHLKMYERIGGLILLNLTYSLDEDSGSVLFNYVEGA